MSHYIDSEYTRPRMGRHPVLLAEAPRPAPATRRAAGSVRRFSHVLLATVLSTLIVIADRMVDAWTSGGLLLALAVLWLAVFCGLLVFTRVSTRLALWITAAWRDVSPQQRAYAPDRRQG